MEIEGTAVVLTGASAGIGRETARLLAAAGATLVLAARSKEKLDELVRELPRSLAVPTDVTDAGQCEQLVDAAVAAHGRIDVLVNNAGRALASPVELIPLEEYRALLELNVIAPLRLMQLVIPIMRRQGGGAIVNLSSQASTKYIPNIAGYASTKATLNALSLTARTELAADGITVSVIRPGIVATEFGRNAPSAEPDALRHAADGTLLPHVIDPKLVAERIVELIRSQETELDVVAGTH